MILDIAGFRITIERSDRRLDDRIAARYGPFLEPDGPADFRLALTVDDGRRPAGLHREHVAQTPVLADGDLDRVRVGGEGFEGELDWAAGRGRAAIPDALGHFDLLVRIVLGVGLLRTGSTLLHAACVLRDRFGIAFAGASGAGKSTVARLCREAGLDVLADEMIVFRSAGHGFRFHGTPFWNGRRASAPCGGILFLVQAPVHGVRQLAPTDALPRLLRAGGAPLALPQVQHAFFAVASEVLRRVPAYELQFAPDAGFWSVLDARPEFAFFRPSGDAERRR